MATGEHDLSESRRCSTLSSTATIRPSKMKGVTIIHAPTVQLVCEESVHYPVFNPNDPRHNPFAESTSCNKDDYDQPEKSVPDSTGCWKRSLPMRSLRKARSGFLALKSEMKRRSSIFTSNDASNSSPILPERPTTEQGPSISQASTAEDRNFGSRLHRIRCQHSPPCRTENCPGKAWTPEGDLSYLSSLLGFKGSTTRTRRPQFPVPGPNQLEPFMKENIPIRANHGHSSGLASQRKISVPASSPSTLLGSTVAMSTSSCSLSVEPVNSQYPGPVRLRYIRGRFYRSIDPRLIGTEHPDDHGVTDWSETSTSLASTVQANVVLDVPSSVKNRVSVPAPPSSDRVHHTNAVPQPRGRSPLRRLFGVESHVSTPLSDRFDSVAHRIRSGNLKVPSDLPKSRSSIASSGTSYASKQSSRRADSFRLSLRLPSMVLRLDLSTILSWGQAESRDPS